MPFVSVGEAAKQLGVSPVVLSNMLYRRPVHSEKCPLRGGRRSIPESYLPALAAELRRSGKLPAATA